MATTLPAKMFGKKYDKFENTVGPTFPNSKNNLKSSSETIEYGTSTTRTEPADGLLQSTNEMSISPRTRQTLRILAVAVASLLVLLAIFFVAHFGENAANAIDKNDLVKHSRVDLDDDPKLDVNNNRNFDYDVESDVVRSGIGRPIKVIKDSQGKAKEEYGTLFGPQGPIRPGFPNIGGMLDIARKKFGVPSRLMHPANDTEIEATLSIVRGMVDADRKKISNKELRFWEAGSEPLRLLLVSTWRSGSTFLGQILQSHPGVFQHFEPLSFLGVRQVRSGKDAFQAQQVLHRLLDCNYKGLDGYLNHTKQNPAEMVGHNKRIWLACKSGPNKQACVSDKFLSSSCQLFPIQFVKTVRLRLNLTQLLLNDDKLRVKVLFLIRDPRGIMNSRYSSVSWCSSSPDCSSPESLCQDLQGDLKVAAAFEKLYPNRFMKIRYEDLAAETEKEIGKITEFLGLEFLDEMKQFILDHSEDIDDTPWTISRKSSDRIALWKKQLPLEEIHAIQNACETVLKSMKYEIQ